MVAIALVWFGHIGDCLFMIIVLANTLIGIIQEIKAKKTIEKISLVSSPTAMVVRDKITAQLPVSELVLDDIILLQTGKQICADSIILEGSVEDMQKQIQELITEAQELYKEGKSEEAQTKMNLVAELNEKIKNSSQQGITMTA